jgi:primosomal protein N''
MKKFTCSTNTGTRRDRREVDYTRNLEYAEQVDVVTAVQAKFTVHLFKTNYTRNLEYAEQVGVQAKFTVHLFKTNLLHLYST